MSGVSLTLPSPTGYSGYRLKKTKTNFCFVFLQLIAYDVVPFGELGMDKHYLGNESCLFSKWTWTVISEEKITVLLSCFASQ